MTLAELRARLRDRIMDASGGADWITDAVADRCLNDSMLHICNWADRQNQGLFFASYTAAAIAGGAAVDEARINFYSDAGSPNFNIDRSALTFRRHAALKRTNCAGNVAVRDLSMIEFEDAQAYKREAPQELPTAYIIGESVRLIRPVSGIDLRFDFFFTPGQMTDAADTPGQSGGTGVKNALPPEYQILIPIHAAIALLASEESNTQQLQAVYAEMLGELQGTLVKRRASRQGAA